MCKELDELIVNNLKLAYSVANKYYPKVRNIYEYEDAQQVCLEGLVKAAKSYDNTKGSSFSTYAYTVIRNNLLIMPIHEYRKRSYNNITEIISLDDFSQDGKTKIIDLIRDDSDIHEEPEKQDMIRLLYNYIDDLEYPRKQILLLRCKGMTFSDISKILAIDVSKVKRQYQSGLDILRDRFDVC